MITKTEINKEIEHIEKTLDFVYQEKEVLKQSLDKINALIQEKENQLHYWRNVSTK